MDILLVKGRNIFWFSKLINITNEIFVVFQNSTLSLIWRTGHRLTIEVKERPAAVLVEVAEGAERLSRLLFRRLRRRESIQGGSKPGVGHLKSIMMLYGLRRALWGGAIIRDHNGIVMAAFSTSVRCLVEPEVAELMVLVVVSSLRWIMDFRTWK
ncbi:Uncharacterized protein Adt_13260 [Abeliophyllum distichum]|uniref:RNase H type-1 domain-containing protein n=1 Tax=Abeliophyllum distichum TaxID=126358 RepID=A0ABD1TWQ9_9LAMI